MIRRITLENYMSHGLTVIEPAEGLTVLIGPNNCGKSAVVSALETLARGTRGDFMVRHGEKLCSVTVETDDGHVITWKRKKSVSYEIDGREVHRDTPDDLHEHLRLPLVKSDRNDDEFEIHFGEQKSPIFLLDGPESRTATFFSASSDAGRLLEIQDRHRDKVKDRKRDRTSCAANIAKLEDQLLRLQGLDSTAEELAKLEVEYAELQKHNQLVAALEVMLTKLGGHARLVVELREKSQAFCPLQAPPPLHEVAPAERLIGEISSCLVKALRAEDERVATKSLQHAPELSDDRSLRAVIARIDDCVKQRDRQRDLERAIESLREVPDLVDERALKDLIANIIRARIELAQPAEKCRALATLQDLPELIEPAALEAQWKAIANAKAACDLAKRGVTAAGDALADTERDIREWATANPACPVCGGEVTADKILEGGHAHA